MELKHYCQTELYCLLVGLSVSSSELLDCLADENVRICISKPEVQTLLFLCLASEITACCNIGLACQIF